MIGQHCGLRARLRSRLTPLAVAFAGTVLLYAVRSVRRPLISMLPNGNYDSSLDCFRTTPRSTGSIRLKRTVSVVPVSVPTNAPVGIPAAGDDAVVRNGGIATITNVHVY